MARRTAANTRILNADAKNRASRSLYWGLLIDVLVAVALWAGVDLLAADGWGDLEWTILSFSLFKSVIQAVVSFVMRRFGDASRIPTPLPPEPSGELNVGI